MREDFAVFIITHGRPDKQLTYQTLINCGYKGKLYFVLDDTDTTIQEHIDLFGADRIFIFNKNHYINADIYDNGLTEGKYACAVYARRATEDIAKSLGLTYFCMMDDDVTDLCIRLLIDDKLRRIKITDMDNIFKAYTELLDVGKIGCVGFGYITLFYAVKNYLYDDKRPLPFVAFIRKTSEPVMWKCWYGEDEIAGYENNVLGSLWLVIPLIMIMSTEVSTGAMSETYSTSSSYLRSISELRYRPADFIITKCRQGRKKGQYKLYKRNSDWFPKILSDKYKKEN